MRVYVPLTFGGLAAVAAAGKLDGPVSGFGVTPALREWYASGDAEELEYAAMTDAAGESLRMLATDPAAPRRRVVVAADVADSDVTPTPQLHPGALLVGGPVRLADIASVHVDDSSAESEIAAAVTAVAAADAGDADAQFVVDGVEDHQLQWYAAQEIADLLRG